MTGKSLSRGGALFAGSRFPFSTASVLPGLLALAWHWAHFGAPPLVHSVLALGGILWLHLGANTLNDYFDWDQSDRINRFANKFSGGSRRFSHGILSRQAFLFMAIAFFSLALASGVVLIFLDRPMVLLIGGLGAAVGILYSTTPFSFVSRGLGELLIFFAFGPLITWGMGYVFSASFSWEYFLMGIPNGFAVTAILWINEFPDFEADSKSGKRNLVVRLGLKNARVGYILLILGFFLSVVTLSIMGVFPRWSLVALLLLPLAGLLSVRLWRGYTEPQRILPVQGGTIIFQALSSVILIASVWRLH
ncbi:prenyltransferase [Myxococcota bacterium]|nr:prenyltransferase [Myxococcota bacterium]MBU1534061.1 prenyltransferase [Myxococcota bacterium]